VEWDGTYERQLAKLQLQKDLGEVFLAALADPETVEILLNADGTLRQERLGQPLAPIGTMSGSSAEAAMRTIAAYHHATITRDNPTTVLNALIRELTVRMALRMRPDRILVGEVRGPAALDSVDGLEHRPRRGNSHAHANNAAAGLTRLSTLVSMHRSAVEGHAQQIDKHHCDQEAVVCL
jgi:Flp pilus assembly CpaF family ATPase